MRLYRIAKRRWDVLAVMENEGDVCQVLDFLEHNPPHSSAVTSMLALLRENVPSNGVPKNPEVSASLDEGLYEFRRQPKRGPKLRVAWFYGHGQTIVCARSFLKRNKTPPEELSRARAMQHLYWDTPVGRIIIEDRRGSAYV